MDVWQFDDQQWQRNAKGEFILLSIGETEPDERFCNTDKAVLAGAYKVWEQDRERYYPKSFQYSPVTGKPLVHSGQAVQAWLPPWGENSVYAYPRGLRRTPAALILSEGLRPEDGPEHEIALNEGSYRFMAGTFQTEGNWLLAVNIEEGLLAVYSAANKWLELYHDGALRLTGSHLAENWSLLNDGLSQYCYIPSDDGLAVVEINIAVLTYRIVKRIAGRCLGAPVLWAGQVFWLACDAEGGARVYRMPFEYQDSVDAKVLSAADLSSMLNNPQVPVAKKTQIYWLSDTGVLQLKLDAGNQPLAAYMPWPASVQPRFQFGRPYLDSLGEFWQLCFDEQAQRYCYCKLSRPAESHFVSAPRFVTGSVNVAQNQMQWTSAPWHDSEAAHTLPGMVFPLLESRPAHTIEAVLTVCVPAWVRDAGSFFAARDVAHDVVFRLYSRNGCVEFAKQRISQPWLTRVVVYNGYLYLHHPDFNNSLYGWKLHR